MLRVVAVEKVASNEYLVSIDRDGLVRTYLFTTWTPLDGVIGVLTPDAFLSDIDDYWPVVLLGQPRPPAPPAWKVPRELVRKLALGEDISLPVVLDEH